MKILNRTFLLVSLLSTSFFGVFQTSASASLMMESAGKPALQTALQNKLQNTVDKLFPNENYRTVKFQVIYQAANQSAPDHLLVYLFAKGKHRVDFASVKLDASFNAGQVNQNYKPVELDHSQQSGATVHKAVCPDSTIQFLSVCPNDNSLEINIVQDVATAATAAGLKTKVLLQKDATSSNYLNWMSCPNLIGNFYDGDANTGVLATSDGEISAAQFSSVLKGAFRTKVTNIWLACEAYNNPMLAAVRDTDQSQKYAAGVDDLDVGPSDNAAACAMKAAIAGNPMTAAFQNCYKTMDNTQDQWGFGGAGSDLFGK